MNEEVKILCVDDEPNVLRALTRLFLDEDYEILTAASGEEGLAILAEEAGLQVVVSDYRMPGMNGVDFLKQVCEKWPDTVRIVLSGYADTAAVVSAINEGQIYKFIPKPWNDDELKVAIAKAVELYFLQVENMDLNLQLRQSNEELQLLNENLEELVRERTNELLFQNKVLQRAQFILDSLPVGVVGLDDNGLIVQCNLEGGKFLDKDCSIMVGSAAEGVLPAELLALIAKASAGQVVEERIAAGDRMALCKCVHMQNAEGQEGKLLVFVEHSGCDEDGAGGGVGQA